ncbi:hypothetical protein B0H10DRAFT_1969748 [Mycena sp. CBHHK59/15]|nr:hypothetical protein B0H10DRAFT_1969748 [Mycena sp. CBHHK59/15]
MCSLVFLMDPGSTCSQNVQHKHEIHLNQIFFASMDLYRPRAQAKELHDKLPAILARLNEEAAEDNVFVRVVAKTPPKLRLCTPRPADGSRAWWVVFVGRDPGIYDTLEAANVQIKGCPNQEYRRKGSKQEALAFYQLMYDNKQVEKWVEVLADN